MPEQLPTSNEFPQYSNLGTASYTSNFGVQETNKTILFKRSDNVFHNHPGLVRDYMATDLGIRLHCGLNANVNRFSFTHETSMFLFNPAEPNISDFIIDIDIWTEDVFRVRYSETGDYNDYYFGLPKEARMLVGNPKGINFDIIDKETEIDIITNKIVVVIKKDNLEISALCKDTCEIYFKQRRSNFFTADIFDISVSKLNGETACFEAIALEHDEEIYGLGERFDGVCRKGRAVDFYNKDAIGTTSPRTYVNIPFYMSTRKYGLFLNSSAPTEWEIGTLDSSALGFSVLDSQMDYFVMYGESPADILKSYCNLTGFSKLPPLWSFGLWMSRNSYTSWDVVEDIAKKMRENDIPCDVLHLDTAWFTNDWDCDLIFSKDRFPEPIKYFEKLRKQGFNISLWQYNFIPPNANNEHYQEAVKNGYLAKDNAGNPYQLPDTCVGSWTKDVIVDFSNPKARDWYANKIKKLISMGAGAIKTDFGEGIPQDAIYSNISGKYFHNLYSLVYNYTIFNATKEAGGDDIVWARSGTAGSQRFPLHWGGDSQCTFDALAGTLRAALSIGISGIPFFSHDIGGFLGLPSDELYVRWAQFGLFSSHSRCHGAGDTTHREPWMFSTEACNIFREYAKLRYSLMPYIYREAEKSALTGLPMVRALYLEYSKDRNVRYIDDEYMFGDNMLIAPIIKPLSETDKRDIYIPAGIWYDYFTKEKLISDGKWITRKIDLKTMPIYIKKGTILEYSNADTTLQDGMGEIIKTEKWDY